MIKVSVVLSIHNRSKLFGRALGGYVKQSMPPEEWEIVLVDDSSTEDLSKVYEPWLGRINLRHIRMDHTKHPVFAQMNSGWRPGMPKRWYHTPALSTNIGSAAARGRVICLCHPEILHARSNFSKAYDRLTRERAFLFGMTMLGTSLHNAWLDSNCWTTYEDWSQLLRAFASIDRVKWFGPCELYWYTSFLPREAVKRVRGVDFEYLKGVAAEDDDFRERVKNAGWPPVFANDIVGFHQDHSDEKERHRQRNTEVWQQGLAQNRKTYQERLKSGRFPEAVNVGYDWSAWECVVSDRSFPLANHALTESRSNIGTTGQ